MDYQIENKFTGPLASPVQRLFRQEIILQLFVFIFTLIIAGTASRFFLDIRLNSDNHKPPKPVGHHANLPEKQLAVYLIA